LILWIEQSSPAVRFSEEDDMLKPFSSLFLGAILSFLFVPLSRAQGATAEVKPKQIPQGGVLSIDVSVNKAADIDGLLSIELRPDSDKSPVYSFSCQLPKGETKCHANQSIAYNATTGTWVVSKIAFTAVVGSSPKELALGGKLSFEVTRHQEPNLPDKATVLDIN
jgi:hypothetical protein